MELVRHRVFSFAQESQRYCNYSKDKYGNEVTFIIPSWLDLEEGRYDITPNKTNVTRDGEKVEIDWKTNEGKVKFNFINWLGLSSAIYSEFINHGLSPQKARGVLPNATKTEVVMTGFISDWRHFFSLRTSIIAETGKPHPDVSALADPLYKEFIKGGYMEPLV